MEFLFSTYEGLGTWTKVLYIADWVLFALFFISIAYLAFFSFLSMFPARKIYRTARREHRFVIIFLGISEPDSVEASLFSFSEQKYPPDLFDIVMVVPEGQVPDKDKFRGKEVRKVIYRGERFSRSEALRTAMDELADEKYDMAVVMDTGNTVNPDFLRELNNAYAAGCRAIQAHRRARPASTDTAMLEAASQEINNSIFRRGHVKLGLSSALAGSGMSFDFDWLKNNIDKVKDDDLEKQLEILLLEQRVLIEYQNDVYVFEDRAEHPAEFFHERKQWMASRIQNLGFAIGKLPSALFSGNIDYCDKLFQWIIPSRTLMLGSLGLICIALVFVSWPLSLKWWGLLFLQVLSFSMAMPDSMIDARFIKALKTMPVLFVLTLFNAFRKRVFRKS